MAAVAVGRLTCAIGSTASCGGHCRAPRKTRRPATPYALRHTPCALRLYSLRAAVNELAMRLSLTLTP
eukprot:scaffold57587_cov63-Phaeocystis_antarctica.AAC.4